MFNTLSATNYSYKGDGQGINIVQDSPSCIGLPGTSDGSASTVADDRVGNILDSERLDVSTRETEMWNCGCTHTGCALHRQMLSEKKKAAEHSQKIREMVLESLEQEVRYYDSMKEKMEIDVRFQSEIDALRLQLAQLKELKAEHQVMEIFQKLPPHAIKPERCGSLVLDRTIAISLGEKSERFSEDTTCKYQDEDTSSEKDTFGAMTMMFSL